MAGSNLSGAEYLASIFGTEKDKVNCSFYLKIGACRHGDKCSRIHNKPTFSQTLLLKSLYHNPKTAMKQADACLKVGCSDEQEQTHFDDFFEEIFTEVEDKYGEIEEMNVCDNMGEHMIGNVYIKFRKEEDAEKAETVLNDRWFGGEPLYAELSPVTDFREACCRQYEMGDCRKGGFCNFMHLKPISRDLRRRLNNRKRSGGFGGGIGGGADHMGGQGGGDDFHGGGGGGGGFRGGGRGGWGGGDRDRRGGGRRDFGGGRDRDRGRRY